MPARIRSIEELRQELEAREKELAGLRSQRTRLVRELAALDDRIARLVGEELQPKRKRAGKKKVRRKRKRAGGKPLNQYIEEVLSKAKGAMRTTDIMNAVTKAGYRSTSKRFYYVVARTLRVDKRFRRVRPGLYKLAK